MKKIKIRKPNAEEIQHSIRCGIYINNKTKISRLRRFAAWWETTNIEKSLEDTILVLKNFTLLDIINLLASITIIISLITWWTGRKERWEDQTFSTWQVVNNATQDRSGVVKIALERLLRNKFSLEGLKLIKANLQEANLKEANLKEANLKEANLKEANLKHANLQKANLKEANLKEANLKHANLQEASLQKANLIGANLQEAFVLVANFQEAYYTNKNTQKEVCKILSLQHPCPTIFPNNFDPKNQKMMLITSFEQLNKIR